MSEFKIEGEKRGEWITLADPVYDKVHRHSFYKTSLGQNIEMTVNETRFTDFLLLEADECTKEWEWVLLQFFGAIVNHYTKNGWTISNITTRSAVLTPK